MSDELINLAAEPTEDPSEPAAPYGTETALGGQTRDQYRAGSPIYAEILKTVEFHTGAGDNGSPAQILREVFGTIARMAMPDGVVKRPNNRPPELREWPAGAIRQLAALCRVYAPGDVPDSITGHTPADVEQGMSDALTVTDPAAVAAEVARIEEEVNAERGNGHTEPAPLVDLAAVAAEVDRQAREREGGTVETVDPDPFVNPAPVVDVSLFPPLSPWADPFVNPPPVPAAEWDRARGLDDIPF